MKNSRFIIILITIVILSCARRPDRAASAFGIEISDIAYTVLESFEQWAPNGDGEYYVSLALESISKESIERIKSDMRKKGAKELPVVEDLVAPGRMNTFYRKRGSDIGLYLIKIDDTDERNYSILIYDETTREMIIYIQIM